LKAITLRCTPLTDELPHVPLQELIFQTTAHLLWEHGQGETAGFMVLQLLEAHDPFGQPVPVVPAEMPLDYFLPLVQGHCILQV